MILAVIVPYLNEEQHLPRLLASVEAQTRPPDHLILVDDGSSDGSPQIADEFAARLPFARVLHRPQRPSAQDRLATAAELAAWHWALQTTGVRADVIAKLDGDLALPARFFEEIERSFQADPRLGVVGGFLSVSGADGRPRREHNHDSHVRGPTKFYRWECYEQISPLPEILGWDTIDDFTARMRGWRTATIAVPGGDVIHLRATGSYDGRLRGYRRRGVAAWGYGAHPLHVVLGAIRRGSDRPYALAGLSYLLGWIQAALRRAPRAAPEVRAFVRCQQLGRLRQLLPVRQDH